MALRITAGLVLMLVQQLAIADCASARIGRALLTDRITDREPAGTVSSVSDDTSALFAFTELLQATEGTIQHHWYYRDEKVAEVTLAVRGKRWRTWSSKNLGLRRDNSWSVRVVDDSGCELTRLTLMQAAPPSLVDPILALLSNGDVAGAKVSLMNTIEAQPEHAAALRWQLQPAIALAQAEEQIGNGNLYIAAARLDSIETATSEQARRKARLQDKLATQRAELDRQTTLSLSALERVFANRLAPCALANEQAQLQLAELAAGELDVVSSDARDDTWDVRVLDRRTGTVHDMQIACAGALTD